MPLLHFLVRNDWRSCQAHNNKYFNNSGKITTATTKTKVWEQLQQSGRVCCRDFEIPVERLRGWEQQRELEHQRQQKWQHRNEVWHSQQNVIHAYATQQQWHETFTDNKYDCEVVFVTSFHMKNKIQLGIRQTAASVSWCTPWCLATASKYTSMYTNIIYLHLSSPSSEGSTLTLSEPILLLSKITISSSEYKCIRSTNI